MIASMTAFACKTEEAVWGSLTWEIRSVNHRYLELAVRSPDFLRDMEKLFRDEIQAHLHRGKVEAILRFQPGQESSFEMSLNKTLVNQLAQVTQAVEKSFPHVTTDALAILAWPGVLQTKEKNREAINEMAISALRKTVSELVKCRQREGDSMVHYLQERVKNIQNKLQIVAERQPIVLTAARQKILTRLEEITTSLDKDRLEQEMVWLAQKIDIAEELQRAQAHCVEVGRVLKQGGEVGRRLDFLMQELNREANTLGSKSTDAQITQAVVEIKVQIEQMREQVQNIE